MASFRYYVEADEIRKYLTELGYLLDDAYYRHGGVPFGFMVRDTTIQVSYDTVTKHPITGDILTASQGMVSVNNNQFSSDYSVEKAARSLKLYRRLYRRFSKPDNKT